MSGLVSLFYSDASSDFQAPSGLATLAKFPVVVLQAEMFSATQDSAGRPYASDGLTPAAWLAARGVETWAYVNPFWLKEHTAYGGPGETFRKAQALQADQANAWLRTSLGGGKVPVWGGKMWAIDIRTLAYRDWLRTEVAALPASRLFVDCGFYWAGAYHKWTGGPDGDRAMAIEDLYGHWRRQGKRLMVNAGWERRDTDSRGVGTGAYPYADWVDGVAIECPGGQGSAKGWQDLVTYKHGLPELSNLRRVVGDWQQMGKEVWLVCVWQRKAPAEYTYSPWPTFEEHADFWIEAAQSMGCSVSVFADTSHAIWEENWIGEWGRTTTDNGPQTVEQRIADCEVRIAKLEGAVQALLAQQQEVMWSSS